MLQLQFGVYAYITDTGLFANAPKEEEKDYEMLKSNFDNLFDNKIHKSSVSASSGNTDYTTFVQEMYIKEAVGKHDIDAKVPVFNISSAVLDGENERIQGIYFNEILDIVRNAKSYTIYTISYVAYINGNILSLAIKCTLKDGSNPQKLRIETINYDMKNDKLLTLEDVINVKGLKNQDVQDKIDKEIQEVAAKKAEISEEGYNVYQRNPSDRMYKIENTRNFFLGDKGMLYIVYPYGNKDYTNEKDIVIF